MRRIFRMIVLTGVALAVLALAGCAGVPKPEADTDSLVVGAFVVSYPDGFFGEPPRTITSGVRLNFTNVSIGKSFYLITGRDGYFNFLSAGGQDYELVSFDFEVAESGMRYAGNSEVHLKFSSSPHTVRYIGHIQYKQAQPKKVDINGRRSYWQFENSVDRAARVDDLKAYLQEAAKDSAWITYEIQSD